MQNTCSRKAVLSQLKAHLETVGGSRNPCDPKSPVAAQEIFASIALGGLHDLYASTPADAVAVNAFGLGLALRAAAGRPIVWGMQDLMNQEAGRLHGSGLREMGLSPKALLMVQVRTVQSLLMVGEEALRSPGVGAVLLSAWGEASAFSLTAARRLSLAAETGGGTVFLARAGAAPCPSSAATRWSVASCASVPLEAGAPGRPSFSATLLRRRGGGVTGSWIMEWDRDARSFRAPSPISGGLVSVAAQRSAAPRGAEPQTGRRAA